MLFNLILRFIFFFYLLKLYGFFKDVLEFNRKVYIVSEILLVFRYV